MANEFHKNLVGNDNHVIHAFTYANAAARTGATGFVAGDIGKVAKQSDNNTYWILTATTPTWVDITSTGGGGSADTKKLFYADQLDNPVNSDWAVNDLAPAVRDSANSALTVRAFDDSSEEGIGFILSIPTGFTQMKLGFKSRAKTGPTGAKAVELNLYTREIPDNSVIGSWSTENNIDGIISLPTTNAYYQYDEKTFTFSSMANTLTPGRLYQFELTRDYNAAGDTLPGDWFLLELSVEFI